MTSRIVSSLLVASIAASVLAFTPAEKLPLLFPDDAFFYLKTANHIGQGDGSTFDGVNSTNGYHPLYMALLSGVAAIWPLEGPDGLRIVFALDVLLMMAWLWGVARVAEALAFGPLLTMSLGASVLPVAFGNDFGTEAKLLLPLAWFFLLAAIRSQRPSASLLWPGCIGAAVCLARLDAILFVGLVGTAVLWNRWSASGTRPTLGEAFQLLGPAAGVLGALAVFNLIVYGHSATVSSWLKVGSRALELQSGVPFFIMGPELMGFVAVAVLLAAAAVIAAVRNPSEQAILLGALGLWIIVYFTIMFSLLRGGLEAWYFPLPFSVAALLGWSHIRARLDAARRIRQLALAAALVGGVGLAALSIQYRLSLTWLLSDGISLASWMSTHLPGEARVYQVDNSGVVAYLSGRSVINGDGLINSWAYQESLRRGELPSYLAEHKVTYFVWDEYRDEADIEIPVPLWNEPPITLGFRERPEIAARFGRFVLLHTDAANVVIRP
jgi:hypothetical protein